MALIDDIFGGIPARLMADWGQDITYIKTTLPATYDPATGTITEAETSVTVKAVLMNVNPKEYDGLYQTCLLYTSPSPRDRTRSRMPSSA